MKCTECGKRFLAPDIELCATAFSQPCKCPKCGSIRTRPSHLVSPFVSNKFYEGVWKQMESINLKNTYKNENK